MTHSVTNSTAKSEYRHPRELGRTTQIFDTIGRFLNIVSVWLVCFSLLAWAVGCDATIKDSDKRVDSGITNVERLLLMPRSDVINEADRLAALGETETGELARSYLLTAARLREGLWRIERRKVDALEAVELYSDAGKKGDCSSALRALSIRAEVDADWTEVTRAFTASEESKRFNGCESTAKQLKRLWGWPEGKSRERDSKNPSVDGVTNASERRLDGVVTPKMVSGASHGNPRIFNVERYGSKDAARIVVMLSEPTTYRAGLLRTDDGSGARIYVDIDGAELATKEIFPVGGLVKQVRLGKQISGIRLVLDLEEAAERRIFYMPEPFRLIIDVARGTLARTLRASGPRVIERVVIDPGHGGHDPGAIGPRGLREKDVTLDIAHRAAPLIARELGLSTLLTRDTDVFVALDERTARANAFRADLFVSIHCNAAEKTGSDGIVTFVLDSSSDVAASRVAAIENAASAEAASELARSMAPVQDEGVVARSLHFAELLQRSTVASLSKDYGAIPNQGVRRAGFYVLAGAHMPAVLYEVSFISNPDGEVRLNTADYRQRLADSIVNAVRAFRDGL
jgi:N-acetylmuramoyl-L-alanine amidase